MRTSPIDVKGRHQKPETEAAIRRCAACIAELDDVLIVFEHPRIRCDALIVAPSLSLALEVESTAKHALINARRDFGCGVNGVLTITMDFKTLREIAQKFSKNLPEELRSRVGLMTVDTLCMLAGMTAASPDAAERTTPPH